MTTNEGRHIYRNKVGDNMNQLHHMRDERIAQRSKAKATQSIAPNFHALSPLEVCVNSSTLPCTLQSSRARRLADHRLSLSRHE
jgi:hypothetical protein